MVAHNDMMLYFSGYVALSLGSLFMNFLSQWEQLNGRSSRHDASFKWLCWTFMGVSFYEFLVTMGAAEWSLIMK